MVSQGQKSAFTLVEILVVLVIIGVLAAIIGFVAQSAMTEGKRSVSIANLRQIGNSAQLYAAAYDDYLPPYHSGDSATGLIGEPPQQESPVKLWKECLMKHGANDSQFYAPLDPYARSSNVKDVPGDFAHLYSSYEHSPGLLRYRSDGYLRMALSTVPDHTVADHVLEMGKAFIKVPGDSRIHTVPYDDRNFLILYLDGHVKASPKTY